MTTTPHETDDATTVDAPEPAIADAGPARRERFRAWRRERPFWGGLVTVVAGVELFFSGQLDLGKIHLQFGVQGMQAMILPIILVLLGILAWTMPVHRVFYGVIALLLSVYSLIGVNLGGFVIGMVLGIVGSVMTLSWLPRTAATTGEATEPLGAAAGRPRHAEGLDLTGSAPGTDDTLVLEDAPGPRPFLVASAETGATSEARSASPAPESAAPNGLAPLVALRLGRRARVSAIGAGLLASALGVGGTGVLSSAGPGALPAEATVATAASDQSGWCVLDPLHVFCSDDDAGSDPAPSDSPTETTSPTDGATSGTADDGTADDGASDTATSAPSDGSTTSEGDDPTGGAASSAADGTTGDGTASTTTDGDGTSAGDKGSTDDPADKGSTDEQSVEAAAKDGVAALADQLKLCLGEGKDLGSSSEVTVPNLSSHLSGSKFEITNSWYKGNVTLERTDGSTVQAMKFTADKAVVPDFRLDVPAKADGSQGLVATSDSITMKTDVVLYATKFSGKLLGIPLTFTPECAPPGFIPLPSMTDVKIEMVANTAESLSYDNPHQRVYG